MANTDNINEIVVTRIAAVMAGTGPTPTCVLMCKTPGDLTALHFPVEPAHRVIEGLTRHWKPFGRAGIDHAHHANSERWGMQGLAVGYRKWSLPLRRNARHVSVEKSATGRMRH